MNQVCICKGESFSDPVDGFHIMSMKVRKSSRVTGAPIESGETSQDYKVLNPIQITVTGYVDCSGSDMDGDVALQDLNEMILNRKFRFYSIITRDGEYDHLILQDCPHDEATENLTMAFFQLVFVEAMVVQGSKKGSGSGSSNSDNSDYVQRGYEASIKSIR